MKSFALIVILLITIAGAAQKIPKAVFVIADGIPADVIIETHTPALDSIAAVGGFAKATVGGEKDGYSQTPTISAVGYNSLLTGTWVNKHNVWDNDIVAPDYHYHTIFRLLKDQYPLKKAAVFSSWEDNRTKLVGQGLEATGNLVVDYHYDGLENDTIRYPHDTLRDFMHRIDESVVDTASEIIRTLAPDLSWVYLEYTDDMGHMYGDHPKFYEAVRIMDRQVSRLWSAIRYREANFNEDWVIYITTDHGRSSETGKGHGGQTVRERRTWIVTNDDSLNIRFRSNSAAIVDIMPSLAAHLGIRIPENRLREIDGVALNRPVSAHNATAILRGNMIDLGWKVVSKTGQVKIWLATTNHFKDGGSDDYQLLKTLPVATGKTQINIRNLPSKIYKIVLEFPLNTLNRWVVVP